MDEFKLLTSGVTLNAGKKSKRLRFARVNGDTCGNEKSVASINFFGEPGGQVATVKTKLPQLAVEASNDENVPSPFKSDAEINRFRKQHRIYIRNRSSAVVPDPIQTFRDLQEKYAVPQWLISNVESYLRFKYPTLVQMQAIPCVLTGDPLIVSAPTGSGKTIAFLLPLLALLKAPRREGCRGLVIVPTRELAVQSVRELDVLRGHKNFRCILFQKAKEEKQRCDVGVATPLKLVQLLRDGLLSLKAVKHVVLDEADKLLDMGFAPQIDEIFSHLKLEETQFLFFSATVPENVQELVDSVVSGATRISIGAPMAAAAEIDQRLMFVTNEDGKLPVFRQLVSDGEIRAPTLVFVQSIDRAKDLFKELVFDGIFADVIHADRPKAERDKVIQGFREKKIWVLICTDLMARGVDFKGVNVVVSWDLPQSSTAYIHRIGRTGRAGRQGTAITFFTLEDIPYLSSIVGVMKQSGCEVPDWLARLKKPSKKEKHTFERRAVRRRKITTAPRSMKDRSNAPEKHQSQKKNPTTVNPTSRLIQKKRKKRHSPRQTEFQKKT